MQSFILHSHEVFIHILQGCFAGTGAIVRLPQCHWSKPDGYGKISQCITTTKHSKAKTVCIFLGIYCTSIIYKILYNFAWTLMSIECLQDRKWLAYAIQHTRVISRYFSDWFISDLMHLLLKMSKTYFLEILHFIGNLFNVTVVQGWDYISSLSMWKAITNLRPILATCLFNQYWMKSSVSNCITMYEVIQTVIPI